MCRVSCNAGGRTREGCSSGSKACVNAGYRPALRWKGSLDLIRSSRSKGETDALQHFHGQGALCLPAGTLPVSAATGASLLHRRIASRMKRDGSRRDKRLETFSRRDSRWFSPGAELVHQRIVTRGEIERLGRGGAALSATRLNHFLQVRRRTLETWPWGGPRARRDSAARKRALGQARRLRRGRGGDRVGRAGPRRSRAGSRLPVGEPLGSPGAAIQEAA